MRYVVRYRGEGSPPALEVLRVCTAGAVIDHDATRLLLVETSIGGANALEQALPAWRVSPEVEYTTAGTTPVGTSAEAQMGAFVIEVAASVTPTEREALTSQLQTCEGQHGLTSDEILPAVLSGRVPITPAVEQWLALVRQRELLRAVGA